MRQRVQLERELIARLKTANIRFTEAQVERIWAIVSAHQAGLSIRKIAGATGLSSSRIHQLLNAPEAKEIPVWLSQLRQSSRGSGGKKKAERPESETEIRSCLAREVEVLRRCTDWLQRLVARLKTASIRFTDAQVERIWAIISAHQAGLSIRKIAGATGLSSSRIHQLLNAPEAKEIPVWQSQSSRGSGGKKKAELPESETEIRSRLAREVEVLRTLH